MRVPGRQCKYTTDCCALPDLYAYSSSLLSLTFVNNLTSLLHHTITLLTALSLSHPPHTLSTVCLLRYAEVRSPGVLFFFKDESSSNPSDDNMRTGKVKDKEKGLGPLGEIMSLKLKLVVSIEVVQKTGKDNTVHLIMELSDTTIDLRYKGEAKQTGGEEGETALTALQEAEKWKSLLLLWKDYSIDYGKMRH